MAFRSVSVFKLAQLVTDEISHLGLWLGGVVAAPEDQTAPGTAQQDLVIVDAFHGPATVPDEAMHRRADVRNRLEQDPTSSRGTERRNSES